VSRTLAADDFATIRARLEELRRERERAGGDHDPQAGKPLAASGDNDAARLRRARIDGSPPWLPTIFVRKPRS